MRQCSYCLNYKPTEHFYVIQHGGGAVCKACMASLNGRNSNVCTPTNINVRSLVKAFQEVNRYFRGF